MNFEIEEIVLEAVDCFYPIELDQPLFQKMKQVYIFLEKLIYTIFWLHKPLWSLFRHNTKRGTLMGFPYHDCLMLQLISFGWFSNVIIIQHLVENWLEKLWLVGNIFTMY